jgi:hypothetical protein
MRICIYFNKLANKLQICKKSGDIKISVSLYLFCSRQRSFSLSLEAVEPCQDVFFMIPIDEFIQLWIVFKS